MAGAIVRIRVTDATQRSAELAAKSGELVELKDRHGVVHRGWVRGIDYELGIDQGWFIWFQHEADFTTADVIAHLQSLKQEVK